MKRITYKHSVKSIQRVWLVQCHKIFNFLNVCKFCNQIWIFKWVVLNHLKNLFLNNPFIFLDRKKNLFQPQPQPFVLETVYSCKTPVKKFPGKGLRNLNYGCKKWNFFVHRIGIHILHTRTHGICVTSTTELKMSINLPLLMFNFLKF